MSGLKHAVLVMAALALAGCASVASNGDPYFYTATAWRMRPGNVDIPQTQQVRVGELLFRQDFVSASDAAFINPFSMPVPGATRWNSSPANAEYAAGATLSQITGVMPNQLAFCDRLVTFRSTEVLDGRRLRLCLVDRERDGVFDTFYWGGAVANDTFVASMIMGNPDSPISVPYRLQEADTPRLLSAGLIVTQSMLGAYRLEFAVTDGDGPITLSDASQPPSASTRVDPAKILDARAIHFRDTDIPLTLDFGGARVEISAIAGDVVTYRVLSGFDPSRDMSIAYAWHLPREE